MPGENNCQCHALVSRNLQTQLEAGNSFSFSPPLSPPPPVHLSPWYNSEAGPQRAGDYAAEVGPSLFTSCASMNVLIFHSTGVRKMQPTLSDKITTIIYAPQAHFHSCSSFSLFLFASSHLFISSPPSSPLAPCFTCSASCATAAGSGSLTAVRASAERRPLPTPPLPHFVSCLLCSAPRGDGGHHFLLSGHVFDVVVSLTSAVTALHCCLFQCIAVGRHAGLCDFDVFNAIPCNLNDH